MDSILVHYLFVNKSCPERREDDLESREDDPEPGGDPLLERGTIMTGPDLYSNAGYYRTPSLCLNAEPQRPRNKYRTPPPIVSHICPPRTVTVCDRAPTALVAPLQLESTSSD